MFELTKEFRFEAAHKLPSHDGKCARLHGHSWKGRVILRGPELHQEGPQAGMLMDFGRIKAAVKDLVEDKLDHHYLNESTGLENPTSEELARWVYHQIEDDLGDLLFAVTIEETCTSSCTYFGG